MKLAIGLCALRSVCNGLIGVHLAKLGRVRRQIIQILGLTQVEEGVFDPRVMLRRCVRREGFAPVQRVYQGVQDLHLGDRSGPGIFRQLRIIRIGLR